jgi:NADH-quinone oxidoreductase subunit I
MDKEFELSKRERFNNLLQRKEELAKPNEYYHKICPTEAAEVDGKLAAAAEAATKKKAAAAATKPVAPATPSDSSGLPPSSRSS